jgi:hypothetical protein
MQEALIDKLKQAHAEEPEAWFSLFTLAGHVVQGRIAGIGDTVTLTAGKEKAEVPRERIEAFSCRPQ